MGAVEQDLPVEQGPVSQDETSQRDANGARAFGDDLRLETLANLAHELRTPLQVLLGYLDILREEWAAEFKPEPRQILDRMNANLHDLARTVENIMEFALAEAGAEPFVEEEITVGSLFAELTPPIEAANAAKNLALSFDVGNAPAVIRSSRRAIRSTLLNLILNAIRFTERGSVSVSVAERERPGEGRVVEFEVRDTGQGMSAALLEQATAAFTQLSRTSARRFRGLGLGLAVVSRNVKALGGTLEVGSTLGQGSSFLVRLPIPPPTSQPLAANLGRRPPLRIPAASTPAPAPTRALSNRR